MLLRKSVDLDMVRLAAAALQSGRSRHLAALSYYFYLLLLTRLPLIPHYFSHHHHCHSRKNDQLCSPLVPDKGYSLVI